MLFHTFFFLILAGFLSGQMACTAHQNLDTTAEVTTELAIESETIVKPEISAQIKENSASEEEILKTYADGIEKPLDEVKSAHALFVYGEPLNLTELNIDNTEQMLRLIKFILLTDTQLKFLKFHIFGNDYGGGQIGRTQSAYYKLLYEGSDENFYSFREQLGNLIGSLSVFKRLIIDDLKIFNIHAVEKINDGKTPSTRQVQFVNDTLDYIEQSPDTPYFLVASSDGTIPKENFLEQFPKLYQGITFSLTGEVELFFTFFYKKSFDFRKLHDGIIPFVFSPRE